jgi:hypothetical protein
VDEVGRSFHRAVEVWNFIFFSTQLETRQLPSTRPCIDDGRTKHGLMGKEGPTLSVSLMNGRLLPQRWRQLRWMTTSPSDPLEPTRSHLRYRLAGCDIQSKAMLFRDFHDSARNPLAWAAHSLPEQSSSIQQQQVWFAFSV